MSVQGRKPVPTNRARTTAISVLPTFGKVGSSSGAGPRSCRHTYAIDGKSV